MTKLPRLTRREFCSSTCQAVALAAVAGSLPGCSGGGGLTSPSSAASLPTLTGTAGSGTVSLTIDGSSPLASVGGAALVQSSNGLFLVARTAQDACTALTSLCTHQRCTIDRFENQDYVCPCHGSRFDTSGRVQSGPAVTALRAFPTRLAGSVLTITL